MMLALYRGTTAEINLTLSEKVTLSAPHFLFVFTPRLAGSPISVVLEENENSSRCEQFVFDVSDVFGNAPEGQYLYTVHEQDNGTNTNPDLAGSVLEQGIARLWTDRAFQYSKTETTTQFIQPK